MNSQLRSIERRAYLTYLARLQSHRRLVARARAWNTLLISFSASGVLAAIASLVEPEIYGIRGQVVVVFVAVLTLLGSVVVASMSYATRAKDMFNNYRKLQRLSVEAERYLGEASNVEPYTVQELSDRYQAILDESENHSAGDWAAALRQKRESDARYGIVLEERVYEYSANEPTRDFTSEPSQSSSTSIRKQGKLKESAKLDEVLDLLLTALPYLALVLPCLLLLPVVGWLTSSR